MWVRAVIAIVLLVLPASAVAQAEKRVALLIGNLGYSNEIGRLANPHNDVVLLEKALNGLGFQVTTVRDAGLAGLHQAVNAYVRRIKAAGPNAVGFFYYSGHGAADAGTNYLIPVDVKTTETGELWDQSLGLTEITSKLKTEAGNATHFVVFDACRNTLKLTRAGSRALVQSKGFVPVAQERGMLIAYATAENELASDVGSGAGPYASVLAEEIVRPGFEAVTMFRNVQRRVRMTINQEPYLGFSAMGDVYLAGAPNAVVEAIAAPPTVATALSGPPARAQEKTFDLKLSHWVPSSHPLQTALEEWGASVEKSSGGSIKYKVYPAQQLGKAFDHYDMAREGVADLTYVNPGYTPGKFPIIGAGELPFLVGNAKGGSQALDAWYRKYAAAEMKDVKFCFAFMHDPGTFHLRSKKIVVPADVKGMKIRPAHATMATFVTLLGGTLVQSSAPEVRDIIEKGVADGVIFPWGSIPLFGIDRVTKYHMDVPLFTTPFAFVFNKAVYGQMSAAQKKVIDEHCTNEWAGKVAAPWADFEHAAIDKLKSDPAHKVYSISEQQLAEWRKAVQPLTSTWAENVKKVGINPEAVMKELKEALAKYQATY